jgi:hypothetical protein
MWFKKALDLNDLNKEFSEERDEAISDYEVAKTDENVNDLIDNMLSGNSWTSESGAIKVNPSIEMPPIRNEDLDATFKVNTVDLEEIHGLVAGESNKAQYFIDLAKTLEKYIPYDETFATEMGRIRDFFLGLENKLHMKIQEEHSSFPKMMPYNYSTEEEAEKIQDHNNSVRAFFRDYEAPRLSEEVGNLVSEYFVRYTKLVNDMVSKIMDQDAKLEWLHGMANKGVAANFLGDDLRSQYLKVMRRNWR